VNLGTIVYFGEKVAGNGRTVRQLLKNMEDGDNPSWWCCIIHEAIRKERESGNIEQPDETQEIQEQMDAIMKTVSRWKDVSVGSLNNQQAGITCPEHLNDCIFKDGVDLKKMWEWICKHFITFHVKDYDWFALLRFLADYGILEKGTQTTNDDFAKQMSEWFPKHKVSGSSVKIYRTGYLGEKPHWSWKREEFEKQIRSNQRIKGFVHLDRICNYDLKLANDEDPVKKILLSF